MKSLCKLLCHEEAAHGIKTCAHCIRQRRMYKYHGAKQQNIDAMPDAMLVNRSLLYGKSDSLHPSTVNTKPMTVHVLCLNLC